MPDHDLTVTAEAFEAALNSIDPRTIDLSPTRPRAGIEHHLRDALGIRTNAPIDIPPPRRGNDGPDLGL